jgi:zinc transporter, ZIP family
MLEASLWGAFAAASLLLGAILTYALSPGKRTVAMIMAFGAGTLLSAVSFEMIGKSVALGDTEGIVPALLVGSVVYTLADFGVSRIGGRKHREEEANADEGSEFGIVIGTLLDGIPESFVMGITLAADGSASLAFIAAVFISNIPEGISSTAPLRARWSPQVVLAGWTLMAIVCGLIAGLGYLAVQNHPGTSGARVEAFAAGAVLTMLATTMLPEAVMYNRRPAGMVVILGYVTALALTLAD